MSLPSGPQLRAARAMAGMDREQLAAASGVTSHTIRRLEAMNGQLRAHTTTVSSLQRALEAAGVAFTDGDEPGVRLRKRAPTAA